MSTASDVANLARVSRWTVARAFKEPASVSRGTLDRVKVAAEELGYTPNLLARSLASKRTNLVALFLDDFGNPYKLALLRQLTAALQRYEFGALLINIQGEQSPVASLLRARQLAVDAAILVGTGFSDELLSGALLSQNLPEMIIIARESEVEDTISVTCDHALAVREITNYIVQRGYVKPAYVGGPKNFSDTLHRRSTFVSALARHGMTEPETVYADRYDRGSAMRAVQKMIERAPASERPDVLFCENDILAVGTIDAARQAGLAVPEDLAVIGFDNVDLAASPSYQLTTYDQPSAEMVSTTIEMLRGNIPMQGITRLQGRLVVRHSG